VARTEKDRTLLAQITGLAHRYATAAPAGRSRAEVVTELTELAAGRSDLLAEVAGMSVGSHEGDPDEARYLAAAQLCLEAGADQGAIPRWIAEGRSRVDTIRARRQTGHAAE
jgi:hypothetical protein